MNIVNGMTGFGISKVPLQNNNTDFCIGSNARY